MKFPPQSACGGKAPHLRVTWGWGQVAAEALTLALSPGQG